MIRKFEYHIVSHILFGLHVKLFMNKIFSKKWIWDFFHFYFCMVIIYLTILIIYATRVHYNLKKLDLKYFPVESISSCKNYVNRKNIHPFAAFERNDLIHMKYINLLYGVIFVATWKLLAAFILSVTNLSFCGT
ncbi:phospholipid or glycerol acyltransferase, putative, fragment [Plasmodium gallinaceum]|uniref:Phospholipid or glycerol acyltransferase, putative n=1 Tax=Plasmodium gallinaceum TaxID=5849 RepID=A0A1J1GX89_PLAGA|nr:phospholipid or glycerol acyltransferase, putative, fragment [Plasmodium gallinaceum]CRG97169.1 phospholipid or glycerol acyltransferase, putative, fragment [Plasmodium gallinaceum]